MSQIPTPSSRIHRVCSQCSEKFWVRPSDLKNGGKGTFCSRKCYNASRVARRLPIEVKFWKYVNKTEGCWLWTGKAQREGYGATVGEESKMVSAHRLSWEIFNGPIPAGLWVLHKCDVRICVRPDHLFLGTNQDNIKDRVSKRRGNVRLVTAFGETKAAVEWMEDPRCLATWPCIANRLKRGLSAEYAITMPPMSQRESGTRSAISRGFKCGGSVSAFSHVDGNVWELYT